MTNKEKIFKVLYKIGLSEEEAQEVYKKNVYLSTALEKDLLQRIVWLKGYGLTEEDIRKITIANPWILIEGAERINYLHTYYKSIGIDDHGKLLKKYPIAMSLNPKDVKDKIEQLEQEGKNKKEIKEDILANFNQYFTI